MHIAVVGAALFVLLLSVSKVHAATYRCGSVFQDRPCSNGEAEIQIMPSGRRIETSKPVAPAAAQAAAPFVSICKRVSQDAFKVATRRDMGQTQARQIAEVPHNDGYDRMVKIINSVYGRTGAPEDVRTASEVECLAEKQREAGAAPAARRP